MRHHRVKLVLGLAGLVLLASVGHGVAPPRPKQSPGDPVAALARRIDERAAAGYAERGVTQPAGAIRGGLW